MWLHFQKTAENYVKTGAPTFKQILFLVKCIYFISTRNGATFQKFIQLLERYQLQAQSSYVQKKFCKF